MKRTMILFVLILAMLPVAAAPADVDAERPFGCSALIAGKGTTVDGSILFAKTEDDTPRDVDFLWYIPRRQHEPGSVVKLANGGTVPQVAETWGFFWDQNPGTPFSNYVINEWGLALGSDACPSREDSEEALAARGDIVDGGIGFELRMILAERAKTAREAVEIAAGLLDRYGYSASGRCLHIVGPDEAWQLQMVRGKQYVARRVRDDEVAVTANTYTIREVDLDDPANFICSPRLVEYATERGWYDPAAGKPFNFAAAYADRGSYDNPRNTDRTWGMARLLDADYPMTYEEARTGIMPPAVTPDRKLALTDIMAIFRDHYEGTALDSTGSYSISPHRGPVRPICWITTHRTTIVQQRSWLPVDIGTVFWRALEQPCSSVFVPRYLCAHRIPGSFQAAPVRADTATAARVDFHFDMPDTTWELGLDTSGALFKLLGDLADEDYADRIDPIRETWREFEETAITLQPEIEKAALDLYGRDKALACELLTLYSNALAERSLEIARRLVETMGDTIAGGSSSGMAPAPGMGKENCTPESESRADRR